VRGWWLFKTTEREFHNAHLPLGVQAWIERFDLIPRGFGVMEGRLTDQRKEIPEFSFDLAISTH
jgi:hypothetical protein